MRKINLSRLNLIIESLTNKDITGKEAEELTNKFVLEVDKKCQKNHSE